MVIRQIGTCGAIDFHVYKRHDLSAGKRGPTRLLGVLAALGADAARRRPFGGGAGTLERAVGQRRCGIQMPAPSRGLGSIRARRSGFCLAQAVSGGKCRLRSSSRYGGRNLERKEPRPATRPTHPRCVRRRRCVRRVVVLASIETRTVATAYTARSNGFTGIRGGHRRRKAPMALTIRR